MSARKTSKKKASPAKQTKKKLAPKSKYEVLDLSIGNPSLYQEYRTTSSIAFTGPMDYQTEALPHLEKAILDIHKKVGNCEIEGRYVVVTNGATQALCAAIYAYSKRHWRNIHFSAPYWFRLPEIANVMNMRPVEEMYSVQVVTRPNNPDSNNDPIERMRPDTITDCCYNWPQYTENVSKMDQVVSIFGIAKMLGHAGLRVGWAIVADEDLARDMKHYVERTTSGVSTAAQNAAATLIQDELAWIKSTEMGGAPGGTIRWATNIMRWRWEALQKALPKHIILENKEKSGMFAWCRMEVEDCGWSAKHFMEEKYNIKVLSGIASGSTFEYFRLNMACSSEEFAELLKRLRDRTIRT